MSVRFRKEIQELLWKKVRGVGTTDEIVYDLRHFERDFNETEQVNGLEQALAEPKKISGLRCWQTSRGRLGFPMSQGIRSFH